jgi:ABC-type branched-subunit amino acid transport system ATPase component
LSFALHIAYRVPVLENGEILHEDTCDAVDEDAIARFLSV